MRLKKHYRKYRMEEPVLVYSSLYVLKLEDECYYIGMSYNLNFRWGQHFNGCGAKWTRLHKPLEVVKVIYPATEKGIENRITKEYIDMYGRDKVKGGSYCS
jgi:predicted GIY-YIG superfamily endonuclease